MRTLCVRNSGHFLGAEHPIYIPRGSEGKGTYMSPGLAFGVHYKKVRFGATVIKIQDGGLLPFAGFALSTDIFSKQSDPKKE